MTKKQASEITGGLSHPDKMPGPAWNIPARRCITGSKLRKVSGSTCSHCYALKGRYGFPIVQRALERRLKAHDDPRWEDAMVILIGTHEWFRWFDSGDLQSVKMLQRIQNVCDRTPLTNHWLPTREYGIVQQSLEIGPPPSNLTIRLSAHLVDQPPQTELAKRLGLVTSTVTTKQATCPAPSQENRCGSCRSCWNKAVANVSYAKH